MKTSSQEFNKTLEVRGPYDRNIIQSGVRANRNSPVGHDFITL